jgi:tRNA G46 methylase TrmB
MHQNDFNWHKIVNEYNQLDLEIGCGTSKLLYYLSLNNPQNFHIGVEINWVNYIVNAQRKPLKNLRYLNSDALNEIINFPNNSVDCIHLYFPTPYPVDNRLFNRENFMFQIQRIIKSSGIIKIVTDDEGYFFQIQSIFTSYHWILCGWSKINCRVPKGMRIGTPCEYEYGAKYFIEVQKC